MMAEASSRPAKKLVLTAIVALLIWLPAAEADAQSYPNHPITLIVPAPAGGGTDTQARRPIRTATRFWL
jgi:tripartite-type tricarboxylate transporter receptor subunit TctC